MMCTWQLAIHSICHYFVFFIVENHCIWCFGVICVPLEATVFGGGYVFLDIAL